MKNRKLHTIVKVKVSGADILWNKNGCSVEYRSLKKFVITKAFHIEKFITLTRLFENLEVIVNLKYDEATIEAHTWTNVDDLSELESKLDINIKELHHKFRAHQESMKDSAASGVTSIPNMVKPFFAGGEKLDQTKLNEDPDPHVQNLPQETPPESKNNQAEKKALARFLAGPPNMKTEIEFCGVGKEAVAPIKFKPVPQQTLNSSSDEKATGSVRSFDDVQQKVTLSDIKKVAGYITLDVENPEDRNILLRAQVEYRRIVVKFIPAMTLPGKQARTGKLISIELIGGSNENLL